MGDALRHALAGIEPTTTDKEFLKASADSLGGYTLIPEAWEELGEALSNRSIADVVGITRALAAATEFKDFAAVTSALNSGDRSNLQFFDRAGNLDPIIRYAAKAAANLGGHIHRPRFAPRWVTWATSAQNLLDRIGASPSPERLKQL